MDEPYTSHHEDPFHVSPIIPPRRPTSLQQWLRDVAETSTTPVPAHTTPARAGTPTHPFLAYPDMHKLSLNLAHDEHDSLFSYDLVEDEDLPNASAIASVQEEAESKHLLTSSTFRNLNLSFRPTNNAATSASDGTTATLTPRTSSRLSIFTRTSRLNTSTTVNTTTSLHARSASLSTLHNTGMPAFPANPSSKWRPSILGHFSQSSQSSIVVPETAYAPPRPSLSSGDTYLSGTSISQTTTSVESDMPPTPSRPSFLESIRSKNRSSLSIFKAHNPLSSSSSICSPSRANFDDIMESGLSSTECLSSRQSPLPRPSHFASKQGRQYDNLLDDDDVLEGYVSPPPKRESTRSPISFSSSTSFPRVSFGSLGAKHGLKKRKRLVISGVSVHETRKFEGVKQWCETFGEIRQITRVANGDLHIDFRRPEVADTVCRVRAKVFIAGVGSVYLSWTTSDKR